MQFTDFLRRLNSPRRRSRPVPPPPAPKPTPPKSHDGWATVPVTKMSAFYFAVPGDPPVTGRVFTHTRSEARAMAKQMLGVKRLPIGIVFTRS